MPAVLLATCATLPVGDEDGAVLARALADRGVDARWAAWTDAKADWSAGLVVLRSTWDYTADREAFLDWVASVPNLVNDAAVVCWNSDKVYLRDLQLAGLPVVPTTFLDPLQPLPFGDDGFGDNGFVDNGFGAAELVVKPSVGAGSRGVGRFPADRLDEIREHVEKLHAAGRTVLIQPYLAGVDDAGETALMYVEGRFSHAVRKGPMLAPGTAHPVEANSLYVEENIRTRAPEPDELAVGAAVIDVVRDRFGADQLYARVDLLPSPSGPVLVELELVEPSLFLQYASGDADPAATFAAAIAARA
jgi:hypothetical protein